jgi:hypothetical protein
MDLGCVYPDERVGRILLAAVVLALGKQGEGFSEG